MYRGLTVCQAPGHVHCRPYLVLHSSPVWWVLASSTPFYSRGNLSTEGLGYLPRASQLAISRASSYPGSLDPQDALAFHGRDLPGSYLLGCLVVNEGVHSSV